MAFGLTLYTTSSDPKQVTKSLSTIASGITIRPTATVNILSPSLIINYNAAYINANYCYCTELSRYYFIDSIDIEIGRQIILHCRVDVLMTYADQIRQCTACVTRSESIGKPTDFIDQKFPVLPNEREYRVIEWIKSADFPFDTSSSFPYLLEVL